MNETFRQRWTRRSLTISVMFLVWFVMLGLYPVLLLVAVFADLQRKRGWIWLRVALFSFWYVLFECLGILAAAGIWVLHLGGRDKEAFQQANFRLQSWWTKMLATGSSQIFNTPFHVEGAQEIAPGPILLLLRHASLTDTILAGLFVAVPHGIMLRYVLKRELLWDPCLDIVGNRLPNYFVDRASTHSETEIEGVANLALGLREHEGVLIYPEGTRFSKKKQQRILEKLKAGDDPRAYQRAKALRHLLPPRLGGTLALLERNQNADIVFCAHAGLEKAATFDQLTNGELFNQTVYVKFWRVSFEDVPEEREKRIDWLFEQWRKIDDYIEEIEEKRQNT